MTKLPQSFESKVRGLITLEVIKYGILFATFLVAIPLGQLADKKKIPALRFVALLIVVFGFFVALVAAREIHSRMVGEDAVSFRLAVAHTFLNYMLFFAFLPVIGPSIQAYIERRTLSGKMRDDLESR